VWFFSWPLKKLLTHDCVYMEHACSCFLTCSQCMREGQGLFSAVYPNMFAFASQLTESLIDHRERRRRAPRPCRIQGELLTFILALRWFLTSVFPTVVRQRCGIRETSSTDIASVDFYTYEWGQEIASQRSFWKSVDKQLGRGAWEKYKYKLCDRFRTDTLRTSVSRSMQSQHVSTRIRV